MKLFKLRLTKLRSAVAAAVLSSVFFFIGAACSAELPRAQLDESERHFTQAYMHFLNRDYWSALDYLERALKANTYLVDYYLLKGLTMNRIGDYGEGRRALVHYLEVRPMDTTVPRVLSYAIGQQRGFRTALDTSALSARWRLSRPDLQAEFGLGTFRPFNVKGLGKADMFESNLSLADTLGDRVYFHSKSMGGVNVIPVKRPAATVFMGDKSFRVFTTDGGVYSLDASAGDPGLLSLDLIGSFESTVIDAAALSAREFAVADPVTREIVFYSFTTFERLGSWAPPSDEMFFEPVALAGYGPWLAVADRGGGKIFFLNAANKRDFFSIEVPLPRDICWSKIGELFVINEKAELFRVIVDFRIPRADAADLLAADVKNGWALFSSSQGDVYCLDITASQLRKSVMMPDVKMSLGFLSISAPMIAREKDKESFVLEASLMSPFVTYSKTANLVVHSVWNNKTIASSAAWNEKHGERKTDIVIFHRPAAAGLVDPALRSVVVENGTDIQIALPSIWSTQKETLSNVLLDSSIIFSEDELDVLTLFCLNNGLELDIWARNTPSVEMVRASALSGGKTIFSAASAPDLTPPFNKMQIRIPLPQELSSSGYPSRSMLTVYLDVGLMNTKDWIPLWSDLLD